MGVAQDYLNIELDSHRNQLIQLELVLTAAMFALALVTVIAGIFGMNLNNTHENSYSAFVTVRPRHTCMHTAPVYAMCAQMFLVAQLFIAAGWMV